jgi:ABC-type Na+ efflux pump permease subunit
VCQALVAALFSSLFHATGSYQLLFGIGAVAAFVSAFFVFAAERSPVLVDLHQGD